MKQIDFSNIQEAGESRKVKAGGYICQITSVEDDPDKEYLKIEYDIAEGDFKGYYKELADSRGFWAGRYIRSYKPKALPFFKRMCSAIAKSNPGFVFDGGSVNSDEKTLVGKLVGLVLAEEEYMANDGDVKTRLYVYSECAVSDIKNGKFKVPDMKKLPYAKRDNQPSVYEKETADIGELPF